MLLEETSGLIGIAIVAILVIIILSMFFRFVPVGLWVTAYFSGVKVSIGTLVGMRLRRVAPQNIIRPLIKATKAGLDININELEAHYLAGGDINQVIDALIAAQRANIDLVFKQAAAIDLAGR
ncbi:MAG: flotillin-like FloA family protein, partial [Carnobacterium sp.]|nr:flotillin-like FloA family protein [Carnobacterium sp.]